MASNKSFVLKRRPDARLVKEILNAVTGHAIEITIFSVMDGDQKLSPSYALDQYGPTGAWREARNFLVRTPKAEEPK
jgi:hypothetical protein